MSSTSKGLRRAGVSGVAALVAIGGFIGSATIAHAGPGDSGTISIVDLNPNTTAIDTASVQPGVNAQSLANVKLNLPNNFKAGDTVDLYLFDSSVQAVPTAPATTGTTGTENQDAAHLVQFSGTPSVKVSNADDNSTATTAPVITAALAKSSSAKVAVNDIVRLTISGAAAGTPGDSNTTWNVDLSGLKVDLGSQEAGELRVVPFGYSATDDTSSVADSWFGGNKFDSDGDGRTFDPKVATYTVPAVIAPVTLAVGTPNNIVADGTSQLVGDITFTGTTSAALADGGYTVSVGGAGVTVDTTNDVTVSYKDAKGKVVKTDVTPSSSGVTVTLSNAAANTTVTITGLSLQATKTAGAITYSLTGPGIETGTIQSDPNLGGTVNQANIEAPGANFGAVATPIVSRIGGSDRYETAANIATASGKTAENVIIASGEGYADALSSGYLSQQLGGAPILLTKQNSLPAATVNALRALGTVNVYVIGGTGSVSAAVEAQLRNTPVYYGPGEYGYGGLLRDKLNVTRYGGADRYATNQIVNVAAASMNEDRTVQVGRLTLDYGKASKATALVASGEGYADALAAAPAQKGQGTNGALPLILTRSGSLSAAAKAELSQLGIEQALLIGGEASVTPAVDSAINAAGVTTKRFGGADRYETATKVADFLFAPATGAADVKRGLNFSGNNAVYLASGLGYADALVGGPAARGTAILLTKPTTLPDFTDSWLKKNANSQTGSVQVTGVIGLGLTASVSDAVLKQANLDVS